MKATACPLSKWIRTALFLPELEIVRASYQDSYKLLPKDIQQAFNKEYLSDICHSLDLLLCMYPYRDLQYGPRWKRELRRRMKLAWVAHNINAVQRLLNNWNKVESELREWYKGEGHQYREQKDFEGFLKFLKGYLKTSIAELAVLYVYLYHDKPIMPLGFMQHLVTLGASGPTLGDFIDIETLTFIEVKAVKPETASGRVFKNDLLSLTINTRLPSAVAVPRYGVKEGEIDETSVVVEFYILKMMGKKKPWVEHDRDLAAPIEEELRPLMRGIKLLRDNAELLKQQ